MKITTVKSKKPKVLTEEMPANSHYFAITGDMTIQSAALDREALLETITGLDALAIDLSQLEEIDTSGVQQLLAIKRRFEKEHKHCHMHSFSAPVTDLLLVFNLENRLGLT
ncbi:MAG: anti-sigma B factor antagonist [Lentisphaeria bacterium]|jgi:anti-sigma B factor antagonist